MTTTLTTFANSNGVSEPVLIVSVPCSALVFQKKSTLVEAGLDVSVSAFAGDDLVGGGVASSTITFPHWDAVVADSVLTVRVPLLISTEKKTILEVQANSLHSSRFWRRRLPCDPGQWWNIPFFLGNFAWDLGEDAILSPESKAITMDLVVEKTAQFAARPKGEAGEQWWVVLAIAPQDGRVARLQRQSLLPGLDSGPLAVSFTIDAAEIPFGQVKMIPLLMDHPEDSPNYSPWQKGHVFINLHTDFSEDGPWEDQLRWLDGKASEATLTELASGSAESRSQRWDEFWANNSPLLTPTGQNHSQRDHLLLIVEANKRFTRGQPGANSERGRALIRYGIPGSINKVGDPTRRDGRWETWVYQPSQRTLVFQDPHGLGDFMLVENNIP